MLIYAVLSFIEDIMRYIIYGAGGIGSAVGVSYIRQESRQSL